MAYLPWINRFDNGSNKDGKTSSDSRIFGLMFGILCLTLLMGRILTFFDKGVNGIGQWCILIFSFLCLALYCFYSFKLCKKQNVSHFKNISETFT